LIEAIKELNAKIEKLEAKNWHMLSMCNNMHVEKI
jgi:hypothetical protein